jgi:hypothetical protein
LLVDAVGWCGCAPQKDGSLLRAQFPSSVAVNF